MKNVILFIWILCAFLSACCEGTITRSKAGKRKLTVDKENEPLKKRMVPPITSGEVDLEREHKEIHLEGDKNHLYEEWPQLSGKNPAKYCEDYLTDRFSDLVINRIAVRNRKVPLRYRMPKQTSESVSEIKVFVLLCRLEESYKGRTIYTITQALQPECVFSLEPIFETKDDYWFYIKDKRCNFERYGPEFEISRPVTDTNSEVSVTSEIITENEVVASTQPTCENDYLLVPPIEETTIQQLENTGITYENVYIPETEVTSESTNVQTIQDDGLTPEERERLRMEEEFVNSLINLDQF